MKAMVEPKTAPMTTSFDRDDAGPLGAGVEGGLFPYTKVAVVLASVIIILGP
jgi:hypothetical protein